MTTLKQIDKKIATFSTNRAKLQALGHEIAVMILRHAAPAEAGADCGAGKGDCTRALKLAKEMPKSWQVQLQNWFLMFSPITVVAKNDKCEYSKEYKKLETAEAKLAVWKIEEATQTPFYDLEEPEGSTTLLDFAAMVKMVEGIAKRLEKRVTDNEVKPEDVPSAQAIIKQLSGLRITRVKPSQANDSGNSEARPARKSRKAA